MPVSDDYLAWVLDQLEGAGEIRVKRMFGGVGLYLDEHFFALIENDILRFKVDDASREAYTSRGMEPFRPYTDRPIVMQYYEVPVEVIEDRAQLVFWAQQARQVAISAAAGKQGRKGRK